MQKLLLIVIISKNKKKKYKLFFDKLELTKFKVIF